MLIENCSRGDYDYIIANITRFWGSDRTLSTHHPMFILEFGDSAYVIKDGVEVIAYLFGFIAQTSPIGYVHLLGVREDHRKKGLGGTLYRHFISYAGERGCHKIKAITTPGNASSIAFHRKLGMTLLGDMFVDGIRVVTDYSGSGQHRVVFEMDI